MKKAILLTTCLALVACMSFAQTGNKNPSTAAANAALAKIEDTIQYSLGVYMMQQLFARTGFQITNTKIFKQAIDDVAAGKKLMVDPATTEQRLLSYQDMFNREKNRRLEQMLFAKMKTQPNYKELASGVLYTIVKNGTGPVPSLKDTILVNVNSMLPDGTIVSSVEQSKQSYLAIAGEMIPGLREVITQMKEGAIVRAIVPASMAYGASGHENIPPNSAVVYDIALVVVKAAK